MAPFSRGGRDDLEKLRGFAASHQGVEGYLEPKTATFDQSLLLVARDGEWARGAVTDRTKAERFCKKLGIPFYDAAVVGYPDRMRGQKGEPVLHVPSPEELERWFSAESADEE